LHLYEDSTPYNKYRKAGEEKRRDKQARRFRGKSRKTAGRARMLETFEK